MHTTHADTSTRPWAIRPWSIVLVLALAGCGADITLAPDASALPDGGALPADGGGAHDGGPPNPTEADLGPFVVDELAQGTVLRQPLARISGLVTAAGDSVAASVAGDAMRSWPLAEGRFKALVRLQPGDNVVQLSAGDAVGTLHLVYEPQTNPRFVRLVYLIASDGDGSFQAPPGEPTDVETAKARIGLGGELMQLYVAESMLREGHDRRTFQLARDDAGRVIVEELRSELTTAELHAMEDDALWYHFYEELGGLPSRDDTIDVAIMSFTRFDPATGMALAHTALGGGRLGLFASGSIHTWAGSLDEVAARFTDERRVDGTMLHDDSAYRQTHWANYATTLGATLHELGHCLSLPHPATGHTIMSRGFDDLNRAFVAYEPPSATSAGLSVVEPEDEPGWHDGNAARLRYHRWLDQDAIAHTSDTPPAIERTASTITITSESGVRQLTYQVGGNIVDFEHFEDAPRATLEVDLAAMRTAHGAGQSFRVTVIDDQGNISESSEAPL